MVGIVSIAQALNISPSTVSRALTRPDLVAAETRTKVLAEAEKQGYVPRVWDAAEHHSGRQRLIGVLLADLANTFSARILNAILNELAETGYTAVVDSSDEDPLKEARILKQWQLLGLRGLIAMPTAGFYKAAAQLDKLPLVLVDRDAPQVACSKVLVDNTAGVKLCLEHLASQGYSRIVFLSGSNAVYTFRQRCEAARAANPDIEIIELKALSYEELYMGAFELYNMLCLRPQDKRPTAIVAANNALAAGILYAVNLKQHRMPEDIALISFGDSDWNRIYPTSVSALRMPADDLGQMAAEELRRQLDDPDSEPVMRLLSPMLMPRASTASVPAESTAAHWRGS